MSEPAGHSYSIYSLQDWPVKRSMWKKLWGEQGGEIGQIIIITIMENIRRIKAIKDSFCEKEICVLLIR